MSTPFLSDDWYRVANLRPHLRSHVHAARQRFRGRAWYVLHDPATNRAMRLSPTAWMLVESLDGLTSVSDAWSQAVTQLGDDAPSQGEVIRVLSSLHAIDLLQADATPDIHELVARREQQSRGKWLKNLLNPLAIRIPLWDPDAFLERALPLVRPFLGWLGVVLWLAVVIPATFLAAQHWVELTENLSDRILAPDNLLLLLLVFPAVKLIHELAHAFATKAAGGEVHELGIMLLVLAPTPYVDASAAVAVRSKWYRAFVGAAGMIVELAIAAMALYAWLALSPGLLRSVMFNLMVITGLSTLLFNGNPLLRYDGYYILADLVEIPNLAQRSTQFYGRLLRRFGFGERDLPTHGTTAGERIWFLLYAPLALAYRLFVAAAIALFVADRYFFVGVLLALWCIATMLVVPAARTLVTTLARSRANRSGGRTWMVLAGGGSALAVALVGIPFPLSTHSEGVVWVPRHAEIRAAGHGFVDTLLARPDTEAQAGTPIVQLTDPDLRTAHETQGARVKRLEVLLAAQLKEDRFQAALTLEELGSERAALADLEQRMAELVTTAADAGTLTLARSDDLPGRYLKRGDLVGYVVGAELKTVRIVVSQDDVGLVRSGTRSIDIKLADRPHESFAARIVRELPGASQTLPSQALTTAGGGAFAADPRDPEGMTTLERVFQFDLELQHAPPGLRVGTRAYARLRHAPEPLALQALRRLRQLLLARLHV